MNKCREYMEECERMTVYADPEPRVYEHEGKTYIYRDLWQFPELPDGQLGMLLVACQYKIIVAGKDRWMPCAEGTDFKDVRPYEETHLGYMAELEAAE